MLDVSESFVSFNGHEKKRKNLGQLLYKSRGFNKFRSRCLGLSEKAAITPVFYESFSENQGRVIGGEGQISDMNSSRWRGNSETLCSCFRRTFQSIPQGRPHRGNWFIDFFSSYILQST